VLSAGRAARHEVEQINARTQQLLSSTKSDIVVLANKIEQARLAAEAAAAGRWAATDAGVSHTAATAIPRTLMNATSRLVI